MKVCAADLKIEGRLVRIGRLAAEGFEFVEDPESALAQLRAQRGVDIFTFMQRLPDTAPKYAYPMEWDNVAALSITTFDEWWTRQIDGKTRNMVRRADKKGIVVKEVPFDESLVAGIYEIYNEVPIRQGRPFPHYGKDLETVRGMSATFLDRSIFIGAFLEGRLIGFLKLTFTPSRSQATIMHIIAMIEHRDKAPTNALIARAVHTCAAHNLPYLVYSSFSYANKQRDNLADFKGNNGFQKIDLPRYYVPLNSFGRLAMRLGVHHGLLHLCPEPVLAKARELRRNWYNAGARLAMHSK